MSTDNMTFFFLVAVLFGAVYAANGIMGNANAQKPTESNASLGNLALGFFVVIIMLSSSNVQLGGMISGLTGMVPGTQLSQPKYQQAPDGQFLIPEGYELIPVPQGQNFGDQGSG